MADTRRAYRRGVRDGMLAAAKTIARVAISEADNDDGIPDVAEALEAVSLAIADCAHGLDVDGDA